MIKQQIEQELDSYINGQVQVADGHKYSQYKLVKRIHLFANQVYPKGKTDRRGNYKYWFDIITPRIDSEVKNIDFDTKDIRLESDSENQLPVLIANLRLKEWLRETGEADEINEAVEAGSGWGNVVWKKVKEGKEMVDLTNFFVLNQTAECLEESAVIERHVMTQSDLRKKKNVWKNVDEVIANCGVKQMAALPDQPPTETTTPYYEIYERNGEVSLATLKEAQGKNYTPEDEDEYVLAKIVVAGKLEQNSRSISHILYADTLDMEMEDLYKEFHRGRYYGRWFRVGLIETLMDCQTRANEIGNQIARGLEYASKVIFFSPDQRTIQNVLTDLSNGDMLRSSDIRQVDVRMQGFDQLMADWNRNLALANELSNAREVVQGETLPAGTPFRLGAMLNQNANKLFEFIREKLAIVYSEIFEEWIIPKLLKDLKSSDIIRLTGDEEMLTRWKEMVAKSWYLSMLPALPPHDNTIRDMLIAQKMSEMTDPLLAKLTKSLFDGEVFTSYINITGEKANLDSDLQTLASFIQLEADPIRRQALIEMAMKKKGVDVGKFPKAPPQALAPMNVSQSMPNPAPGEGQSMRQTMRQPQPA